MAAVEPTQWPHTGNSTRSALRGRRPMSLLRRLSAPPCSASAPYLLIISTPTATARPRSGLCSCCRLSTDLLLFAFVHAGCAHVSLASRTSQHLTSAYLAFVHSQSLVLHHTPCHCCRCQLPTALAPSASRRFGRASSHALPRSPRTLAYKAPPPPQLQ
jgi:hypothetical protein